MKKTTRIIALICAAAIILSALFMVFANPSYAATNNVTNVNYEALPGYIASYNPDLKIAETSTLKLEKATYDLDKQVSDLVDSYMETNEKYWEAVSNQETPQETIDQIANSLDSIQDQIDAVRKQTINSDFNTQNSVKQASLTYQQKLAVAQQTFLNNYLLLANKDLETNVLENLETKEKTAKKRYELKMMSLADYQKVADAIDPQKQVISELDYNIHKNTLQLKTLLGIPLSNNITYGSLPNLDFSYIDQINIGADLALHIQNNKQVQIKQTSLNNARTTAELQAEVVAAEEDLAKTIDDATITFEASYSELKEKRMKLINSEKNLAVKRNDLAKQKQKLDKGMISQNAYKDTQDELFQLEKRFIIDKISLFTLMENYKNSLL